MANCYIREHLLDFAILLGLSVRDLSVLFLHLLRRVCAPHAPGPGDPFRDRPKTFNALEPSSSAGPSWLTALGHTKNSLWSLDLFRCESAVVRTHVVSHH
jgi:hypothetical protein